MTVRDWLGNVSDYRSRYPGPNAARAVALSAWNRACHHASQIVPNTGREIWTREWDVLVILDACRPDALEAVAADYPFLPAEIPTHPSRGSWSREWTRENFGRDHRDELADTALVSGNVYTREFHDSLHHFADPEWFAVLDEVWRDGWDQDHGTVPPETVRDRAISTWRDREQHGADQMIVHMMQPHAPYRSLPISGREDSTTEREERRRTVWDDLYAGVLSTEQVRAAYRDNLRWALDSVELLLENLDADRVAISADHTELFGRVGLYGHPDVPLPELRTVPWVETTATDERTLDPDIDEQTAAADPAAHERLKALGYA